MDPHRFPHALCLATVGHKHGRFWCLRLDSNQGPDRYERLALPLSYRGIFDIWYLGWNAKAMRSTVMTKFLADRRGFEPLSDRSPDPAFETGALNHSATCPCCGSKFGSENGIRTRGRGDAPSLPFQGSAFDRSATSLKCVCSCNSSDVDLFRISLKVMERTTRLELALPGWKPGTLPTELHPH